MKPKKPPPPADAGQVISALIETLHQTEHRLEELTAGEVDAVADRDGRTFLLRRAQEHLRHSEAAKQAAILNALPAHVALLDTQGRIISVNEAWRRFAGANALRSPGYGIGLNYLEICDRACGDDSFEARQVAAGIRSVLADGIASFSSEYPCDSPTEKRWFRMMVTPLSDGRPNGAVTMHLDITARKQGEDALRESKNLLQLVVENVPSRIFWKDRDLRYLGCNTLFAKDAGHSRPDELTGKTDFEMGWKDQAELYRGDDRAVLDSGVPKANIEEPQTTPDGSTIWLRTSKVPLRDNDNRIIGILGLYDDVTARKRSEQDLRESERRFSDLLRNVELISMMLDSEARITYCNEYLLRLTGWRREEVIGRNWFEVFVPPENDDLKDSFFTSLLANLPEAWHHENEVLTRSGERRLIRWNNSVLRSGAGDVIGTASIGEDITEGKIAEETLKQHAAELEQTHKQLLEAGERARASEAQYRLLFDSNPQPMWLYNMETLRFVAVNAAAVEHYGYSELQFLAMTIRDIRPVDDVAVLKKDVDALRGQGKRFGLWRHRKRDGSLIDVETSSDRVVFNGQTVRLVLAHDVTEVKHAEIKIRRQNRVYAVLSGINTLIVRVRDRDELFQGACRIAVDHGQFKMAWIGVVDRSEMKVIPVASAGAEQDFLAAVKDRFSLKEDAPLGNTLTARAIREKNTVVANDLEHDPTVAFGKMHVQRGVRSMAILPLLISDEAVGVLALYANEAGFFDDAELKLLTELAGDIAYAIDHLGKQERLDYLAYYDALTGLANRSLFLERVAQYLRSAAAGGHKLAVILIDLERFKNINDSLGRSAGDALLRQVAEWLKQSTGDASLLARVDADHFAVVQTDTQDIDDPAQFLEQRMEAFLQHPFRLNDAVFRIAVKAGVAVFPDDGADADTLFKHAEAALKNAKASGQRYLFYTQTMTDAVAGKLSLENQLRQALDNEEFVLHYQPKVNLVSGKMSSVEALIRWNDPRTGLVPPGRFIPILEETGMIYEVGRWAVRKAISDYLRWRAAGLNAVRIAVNVSALQLRHRGFIDEVRQAIDIDAQAAAGLELEITESLIMEDVKGSIASLQAIRDLGVSIAIDDFGTGFSSLSYLAKLPVDTLKIDRSFVIDMTAGPEGLALMSTIINLAHSLKLKVVAEGVETEEQSRLLRLLSCDEMQGFLFSKPVPAEAFETQFLVPLHNHNPAHENPAAC